MYGLARAYKFASLSCNTLRSMCTNGKKTDLTRTVSVAKLIGTVSTKVFNNSSTGGSIVFYLRTFNRDNFYDMHKIVVPESAYEYLPRMPRTGEKLLIVGNTRCDKFTQGNGKNGTSVYIMARQIYLCDGATEAVESKFTQGVDAVVKIEDRNHLQCYAQIPFDISNCETFSMFSLAVHYPNRTDFMSVFVYNDVLRNIVRHQFKRLDRVRVEGTLKYKTCIDENGKKRFKGHIEATKIAKLIPLRLMEV